MRLLNTKLEFCDYDDIPPPYAILSHTWSDKNDDEVTYHDLKDGTTKPLLKLELCRDWAKAAHFEYFWIDTCCINKRDDAEISYAIRSMWRWYSEAGVCFVYLSDLSKKRKLDADWRESLKECRWFTRGWTLQELMASKRVEFYARDGYLGSREDLLPALKAITGIDLGQPLPGHATRLSWVAKRITKRPEDKAYCMLGICDVSLDARYGEGGESAWRRLQDAIAHRHGTIALEVGGAATNKDHRATVLEALRFDALETRRKTIEVAFAKTCKWILSHPACVKWLKQEHKFFWIKGKPGAGKSVLIKYLDQHVTRRMKKSNAIGLYFYFNARGGQLERSFLGLYRSLLVQLVDSVPELAHELDALDAQFDLPQLQRVLTSAMLGLGTQIWLFIDALDECREGDVRELITFLNGLQEAELYLVLEDEHEHRQDLSTYVEKLDLEGEELAEMQRDIVAKSNGIFLWVFLVVGILQEDVARARFHGMQARLRDIPEGLPELFKTILLRDNEHKDEFLLCLRWILYAWRPLTLKEWHFAMMAGADGRLEWDERTTDHRMETFLLSSSKGLAELTKGKTVTVQFIHESVRDFLIHQGGLEEICGNRESLEGIAHEQLKQCCARAIVFDLPRRLKQSREKKQLFTEEERVSLRARYPFAEYAITHILHHADQAAVRFSQKQWLANEFTASDWIGQFNAFQKSKPNVYGAVPSLSYLCAERDLARLLPRPTGALSLEYQQRYRTPLIAAILHSSWQAVRIFLDDMNVPNIDETITEFKSTAKFELLPRSLMDVPWHWAARNGLIHLSKHFMTSAPKEDVDAQRGHYGNALQAASWGGRENVVQMLLDAGGNVNAQGGEFGNALQAASYEGHGNAVQVLINAGAELNAQGGAFGNALYAASCKGHEHVVHLLIAAGADVNAQGGDHGNALQAASHEGHEDVVQVLIDAGADVNAQGGDYGNALPAASYYGNEHVVQRLLDGGADVNAQEGDHSNALQAASFCGHEKVVRMLLKAGADVNAQGGWDGNALQAASQRGHKKIVQRLLDAGADIDAQGGDYGNALQAALEYGNKEIVQMLIDAGAGNRALMST